MNEAKEYPVSIWEQETHINIDYQRKKAFIYTTKTQMAKKLKSLLIDRPEETRLVRDDGLAVELEVPISWITIRPKVKRELSEEQKETLRQRLIAMKGASS